jgi:hypothetical protein
VVFTEIFGSHGWIASIRPHDDFIRVVSSSSIEEAAKVVDGIVRLDPYMGFVAFCLTLIFGFLALWRMKR